MQSEHKSVIQGCDREVPDVWQEAENRHRHIDEAPDVWLEAGDDGGIEGEERGEEPVKGFVYEVAEGEMAREYGEESASV